VHQPVNNSDLYATLNGRYGTLTVFANDTGAVTRSIGIYGEWAENELSFLRHFLKEGDTVLDVGAYIGTHTLAFATFVGSSGKVIALEAQPESFELLRRNVESNLGTNVARVRVLNTVVASRNGEVGIPKINSANKESFGSASLLDVLNRTSTEERQARAAPRAIVAEVTLDSLNLQDCALIKVDVEGLESEVLLGARETLVRCSPAIYCECNSIAGGLRTLEALRSVGYRAFAHVVDAFNPDNFLHCHRNVFGKAREVALFAVPDASMGQVREAPVRRCELLLKVDDADDLALALLNKPQYPFEVLQQSRAAANGGAHVIDVYKEQQIELVRIRRENAGLKRSLRGKGEGSEAAAETDRLNEILAKRDSHIIGLQSSLQQRTAELDDVHAILNRRDTAIAGLQSELRERGEELASLNRTLTERDIAISTLQSALQHQGAELSRCHEILSRRDADIAGLQCELQQCGEQVSTLNEILTRRDLDIGHLQSILQQHSLESSQLHQLLSQRDSDIARLQSLLRERSIEATETRQHLSLRDREIEQLQCDGSRLAVTVSAQDVEIHALRTRLEDANANISRAEQMLRQLEGDVLMLRADLSVERSRVEELRVHLDEQTRKLTEAQIALLEKELLLAEANNRISTLYSSLSWRLTDPLRWLRQKLRRNVRKHD
jgi:FkbM family methyltransferase